MRMELRFYCNIMTMAGIYASTESVFAGSMDASRMSTEY
jgi:hypothetical protein